MTAPFTAFCDADVLVPIVCCDSLLTASEVGLVDVVVSEPVLAEVERNLVENFPHVEPARLHRRVANMRVFLADQIIEVSDLDALADVVNAKDHHVVTAAIEAEDDVLVTNDRRLRDEGAASSLIIGPMSADDLGAPLWDSDHEAVNQVIDTLLAKRRRRPPTRCDFADQLARHLPTIAEAWLSHTDH